MGVGSFLPWEEAINCWRLALSEADDLAVGRGDDDLALRGGRGGRQGRGDFVFPDLLAAGEIEPVNAALVGADERGRRRSPATSRRGRAW
jgi:hypothetical protein